MQMGQLFGRSKATAHHRSERLFLSVLARKKKNVNNVFREYIDGVCLFKMDDGKAKVIPFSDCA